MPERIGFVVRGGLDEGAWLHALLASAAADADSLVSSFLDLFGADVDAETALRLRDFATGGLPAAIKAALDDWQDQMREHTNRRDRLARAIGELERKPAPDDDDQRELRWMRGERHAVIDRMRVMREEYSLRALERMGLLPNYTLLDDAATLSASLWSVDDTGAYDTEHVEYRRPADLALTEFAPGNGFYVDGHRLLVDAVEIGTGTAPLDETWRLCPECGYGAPENSLGSWTVCPRCRLPAVADAGARHQMLRLRQVFSVDSEERTRVFDETDERDRERYRTVTTVDVDPAEVVHAWQHRREAFGMELARTATIRAVNLGPTSHPGQTVTVGGARISAPRFRTCRHCGMVSGIRNRKDEHRAWCLTRTSRTDLWEHLALFHEVRTEVVRLLLPVATFQVAERLASFRAALLLGLRLDFGGEPEHLAVTVSDYPGPVGGRGRLRFLVLHDTVPGGTGYLGRLADPERMGTLLERARQAVSRCECRQEGLMACHRCLLGAATSSEIQLVSRPLALELLDQLLDQWDFEPVPTVAAIGIGSVVESELERSFKAALRTWAAQPANHATLTPRPAPPGRESFELRLQAPNGDQPRWLLEEQRILATQPSTQPDFVLTRQDRAAAEIAVYLDGYAYHAAGADNRLADDAAKRRAVRASGRVVWALSWDDVSEFAAASEADVPKQPPDRPLLGRDALSVAGLRLVQGGAAGADIAVASHNPLRQLLEWLRQPDPALWEELTLAWVAGAASSGSPRPLAATAVRAELAAALTGTATPAGPPVPDAARPEAMHCSPTTLGGLRLECLLDARDSVGGPNAERWTVIARLPDQEGADPAAWRDWLGTANLLQWLRGDGRQPVVTTATDARLLDVGDLASAETEVAFDPHAGTPGDQAPAIDPDAAEELELVLDPDARSLTEAVLRQGAPTPVAGFEPNPEAGTGWMVEVAWPDQAVAILSDDDPARDEWLRIRGWDSRPVAGWTPTDLLAALTGRP